VVILADGSVSVSGCGVLGRDFGKCKLASVECLGLAIGHCYAVDHDVHPTFKWSHLRLKIGLFGLEALLS